MAITFGSSPLLQFDSQGVFQTWLNQFQRIEETPWFSAETQSRFTVRNITRTGQINGNGLPLLNYSKPIQPRFNSLYFPTGAARFAVGFFFCDNDTLGSLSGIADLTIQDQTFSNMELLSPVRINATDEPCLWALCFVDQRFAWQFKNTGDLSITKDTSWETLFSDLGSSLGVSIDADSVDDAYLVPDWIELQRKYESVPVLLDAVAASCGQRIVVDFDGSVCDFYRCDGVWLSLR